MKLPNAIKIGSDWWVIKMTTFEEEPDKFGECDFENKCIRLNVNQSSSDMFYTIIHEALHAAIPDLVEEAVIRYESTLRSLDIFNKK